MWRCHTVVSVNDFRILLVNIFDCVLVPRSHWKNQLSIKRTDSSYFSPPTFNFPLFSSTCGVNVGFYASLDCLLKDP